MPFPKLFLPLLVLISLQAESQSQPNIIYIMADDLGYGDLSGYGRKEYQTPNLDKLASEGVKLVNAYAGAALCTPTRTSFMTGRYPARTPVGLREPLTGSRNDSSVGLSPATVSLPALLKKGGYETYLAGKWHLGFLPEFSPVSNGFDEFLGSHSGGVDYISHTSPNGSIDLYENEQQVTREGYMTDIIRDRAIDIIRRSRSKPFFLCVMFNAPHWPWQAPGSAAYPEGVTNWHLNGTPEIFAAMMKSLDDAVGQIMMALKESGLDKNTMVIFTSDNGGERFSYMGGLSGQKSTLREGGIRVPAFARWPGKIPANTTTSQVAITMDWTATILSVAGTKPDPAFPLDGTDLLPVLTGKASTSPRTFYWRLFQRTKQKSIRDGNWKYLADETGEYLFDLSADAAEEKDLKDKQPEIFNNLKAKYADWEKTVLAPVPLIR